MQYLLNSNELHSLVSKEEVEKRDRALEAARILILYLSGKLKSCGKSYCGECPISAIGAWPENRPHIADYEISKLICSKQRRYSK